MTTVRTVIAPTPSRYTFLGLDVPDELLPRLADRLTLFDTRYRTHVVRMRTETLVGVPNRRQVAA